MVGLIPKVGTKHEEIKNCVTNFAGWLNEHFERLYREDRI